MKIRPRIIELKVPLLTGEETLITVGEWILKVGARVEIDQDLVELSSDDESFMLPSPIDGTLIAIEAESGDKVEPGQVLAIIEMD
jgi:2-oxoglutarate dehydrogenase E2 component (dihydrolipoamide succinyltransferase)